MKKAVVLLTFLAVLMFTVSGCNSKTEGSISEPISELTQTAQGKPIVKVIIDGEEKEYVEYDETKKVTQSPMETDEYGAVTFMYDPKNYDAYEIDGVKIINSAANVYISTESLIIEKAGEFQ